MTPWAIVVGINLHPEDSGLTELYGAVADAADFAEWCLHPQGGAVAPERLFFWSHPAPAPAIMGPLLTQWFAKPTPWPKPTNLMESFVPPMDDRAPKSGQLVALTEWITGAAYDIPGDHRVYVLFAGHGVQVEKQGVKETCFLAGDYVDGLGLVPCGQMARSLLTNGVAEVVMFLDCCRTPLSNRTPLPDIFPDGGQPARLTALGRAANAGQTSFEVPDLPPKRGVFTQAVTEGLRTRRNAQGALTFADLGQYVCDRAPGLLGGRGPQNPQFVTDPPNPDPGWVLLQGEAQASSPDIVIDFTDLPAGAKVSLIDNGGRPIQVFTVGQGPVTWPAPPGLYGLSCNRPRRLKMFNHTGPGAYHASI
jgi:hypothetical protein